MNDTQGVPGASLIPDSTDIFTITVFVLIALFAIGAIAIIIIGARRKRRRVAAEEVVQERIEQEAAAPPPPPQPPAPTPRAAQEPVSGSVPGPTPSPAAVEPPAARVVAEPAPEPAPLAGEPIAVATAGTVSPAAEPASAPSGDDPAAGPVTQLKGLGPKVAARLAEFGITTVGDLAALSDTDAARLDADLGAFAGRMTRDRWIEQARLLAAGDRTGFEAVFGRL